MVHRGAIFAGLLWLAATIPWLLTRALQGGPDWVMYSIIFGSINTVGVLGILLFWTFLRKKLRIPSAGASIVIIYIALSIGIFVMAVLGQAKEPLIWEGAGPALLMLCLLSMASAFLPFPSILNILLGTCIGGVFYFWLGKTWQKLVLAGHAKVGAGD